MLLAEFYRQTIAKIDKQIKDAELSGDFSKVVSLMKEKSEWDKRAREDENLK